MDDKAGTGKWEGDFFIPAYPSPKIDIGQTGISRIIVVNQVSYTVKASGKVRRGNGVVAAAGGSRLEAGGQEVYRHKKTPHSAGFQNLINIISEKERMSIPRGHFV
jgi:hypothetical protein